MFTHQISEQIDEIYGFEISEGMISNIIDRLLPRIYDWQQHLLSLIYPIAFIDAIHFSVRDNHTIKKLAAYIILGINDEGKKEVLSIQVEENESSKYWLGLLNELKNRGIKDILHYPDYLGCCKSLDSLGRIRGKLKDLKLHDNTIIIYTGDHGSHFKAKHKELPLNGADDYKRSFYENTIKVALIVYGKDFEGRKIIKEIASLIDIPKRTVEIATKKSLDFMEGVSLIDLASDTLNRDDVFIQISESYVGRALRTKKYKYCIVDYSKNPYKDKESLEYTEKYLYDLEKDSLEKINLINDKEYENIRIDLRTRIKEYIRKVENLEVIIK